MTEQVETVPDWAKDAVWYQVFPERFRNGDPANDPALSDMAEPHNPAWSIMPWGIDWYRQEPWERERGGFFQSVYLRRFGGDLIGLRDKLDYLQDLGVTALYLNPVFMAPSLHKYDGSCFHHIDPTFGPDRVGDLRALAEADETEDPSTWILTSADRYFLDLVKDIHDRGMRVIIDGVFNHTGREFFAFRDLLAHGKASRYRDWYKIKEWKDDRHFLYDGWFGHQALPELARDDENLAPPVRQYIFDCTTRWMDPDGDGDPSDGIDGWRLDVAFCVPHGFWKDWRKHVKSINPDGYLTAEIVTTAEAYLRGDEFDAVMNYAWLYPTVTFFNGAEPAMDTITFRRELDDLRDLYPPDVSYVQQNLYDSHDVGRIASVLHNPSMLPVSDFDHYFNRSRVKHDHGFDTTRPSPEAYARLRQMVIFQMTYIGAPMIYYGTEVGIWGANDPDCRQPMLWDDVEYEPETHRIDGSISPNPRKPDMDLFRFYRKAIGIRHASDTLRRGDVEWIDHSSPRVLAYRRSLGHEAVVVVLNAGESAATWEVEHGGTDLWTGSPVVARAAVDMEPGSWLLIREDSLQ